MFSIVKRIVFVCLCFSLPGNLSAVTTQLEYEGISFTCYSGCGHPKYDGAAYEILRLFETADIQLTDFYCHSWFTRGAWIKNFRHEQLDNEDSPICRRQKEFLYSFAKLKEQFLLEEGLYYQDLRKREELHLKNIEIIQRRSENCTLVAYRNGKALDCPVGIYSSDVRGAEFILGYERDELSYVQEQLRGENDFVKWRARLEETYTYIDSRLKEIFLWCLENHQTEGISFRAALESLLQKDYAEAIRWLRELLDTLEKESFSPNEIGKIHLLRGQLELEYGQYAKAVESLTIAIAKCPTKQEAYFERAAAYFELGDFEKAIEDCMHLKPSFMPQKAKIDFQGTTGVGLGIAQGIIEGFGDGCVEAIPKLLNSCHGLSRGLWAFCTHPIGTSTAFANAALDCVNYLKEHCTKETMQHMVFELRILLEQLNELEDFEKGEAIGRVIGKFGTDIFMAKGSVKLYQRLKTANQSMTFRALTSSTESQQIIKKAAQYHAHRQQFLESSNLKIQWDKQGKHLQGHKNYDPDRKRSVFEHPDPNRLVKEHAGKGRKIPGSAESCGQSGYKEVVDFQEYIGCHVDKNTGIKTPSTRGVIHYAKDGVHIVPTKPQE